MAKAGPLRRERKRTARPAERPPPYDLVLRGGRVIDPARDVDGSFDVAVRGTTIAAVAPSLAAGPGTRVIDVRDRL